MSTAKNDVFIGLQLENCYLLGELTFSGGEWGERGDDQIFGWWWALPHPSPPVGKTLYVGTANCMIYGLFHDHKPLIMWQSIYHQNWIAYTRRQLAFDVRFWPLLSIRKFPVQTWLGAWPDVRNPTLLQGSKIRMKISTWCG